MGDILSVLELSTLSRAIQSNGKEEWRGSSTTLQPSPTLSAESCRNRPANAIRGRCYKTQGNTIFLARFAKLGLDPAFIRQRRACTWSPDCRWVSTSQECTSLFCMLNIPMNIGTRTLIKLFLMHILPLFVGFGTSAWILQPYIAHEKASPEFCLCGVQRNKNSYISMCMQWSYQWIDWSGPGSEDRIGPIETLLGAQARQHVSRK